MEAHDAEKPIAREADGRYYLHLTAQQRVEITACRLCGGYKRDAQGKFSQGTPCTCGSFARWAADPALPIRYDARMNEYNLTYNLEPDQQSMGIFYYCVVCGGRLSESKRGGWFMEPPQAELEDFRQRIGDLKTIAEVIALLGQPDAELSHEFDSCVQDRLHLRRQIGYRNIWESLTALFQENTEGTLLCWCHGKQVKTG